MNKYEVLKVVVILQAVCMIALTGFVIVKMWPPTGLPGDEKDKLPDHNIGQIEDDASVQPSPAETEENAAIVGGKPITYSQLTAELYERYGDETLRAMMVRKAIDLESEAYGFQVMAEEKQRELAAIIEGYDSEEQYFTLMKEQLGLTKQQVLEELRYRLLLEKIMIRDIDVTDLEVQTYISLHPEQFSPRLQIHLQWILTDDLQESNQVLGLLENGEYFGLLARTYSVDSFTAENGGDLGIIEADDPFYNQDLLETASHMQVGHIAGPIAVEEGYAIILLAGRTETGGISKERQYDVVRKQLALDRANPMRKVENELLDKYEAVQLK